MTVDRKIPGTDEAWERRELGVDANFVAVADDINEDEIDLALELQPISIRLQKSLIDDFKMIAQLNGIGYQPLMRQVLVRFADCEKKKILRQAVREMKLRREEDAASEEESRSGTHG
ncbi:hypothetical protein [Thiocystis violacea]|uniref:hypothetical protein n=1 Tax=Thiocystis violacea TaxID=13725 RepID=UPI001907470A|nr:hypothetical protein [Thiocystis violacea]MBK1720339.1 hypothetical protein [Thiocystis violacea]